MNKIMKIMAVVLSITIVMGLFFTGVDFTSKNNEVGVVDKNTTTNVETKDESHTMAEVEGENPTLPFDEEVENYEEYVKEEIVKYSNDTLMVKVSKPVNNKVEKNLKKAGVEKLETMFELDNAVWYVGYLKEGNDVNKVLADVRNVNKVVTAEYNFEYKVSADFDSAVIENPRANEQDHFDRMGYQDSWIYLNDKGVAGGSSNVIVAVIDTGVDYEHEDLKSNMWVNMKEIPDNGIDDDENGYVDDYYGVDITAGKNSGMDDHGHGTHVAGIVAASNNKTGIVGLAYNTKIMSVKAADASGVLLQNNIAKAIIYAYDHGASVINMSFGGSASSIAVQDALAVAYNRCVLVASAGNDGDYNEVYDEEHVAPQPNYPAALSYVVGVMSVDGSNYESSFTNYDGKLYTNAEYEVYAPGEQILSTIPGNRYARLSGTSMAAPVVAAQAALLRSVYADRDMYPTKFIYGQVVGTAEAIVKCGNVKHNEHNIPGLVNYHKALTELPKPDIGLSDYRIFDSLEYAADTDNIAKGSEEVNNGDGIIDAGEILAVGFTLKNRWGMSKDTVVSVDVKSNLDEGLEGVENPYVTILNNDVNYDSIGTYSEKDCGKVYSEDGEVFKGWEKPFYIQISKDIPNNYTVTLNLTITYKNGLNPDDTTEYVSEESIVFEVRKGVILPNAIKEDTTLTKENYYILQNTMVVQEGVTLTIEPGTKIQFWCSDPKDAYAQTGIAYIDVAGTLIANGTAEEPIEMFPSDYMSDCRVFIENNWQRGYVELNYVHVTNPFIEAQKVDHCEFKQNFYDPYSYKALSSGNVYGSSTAGKVDANYITNSVFYKLGDDQYEGYAFDVMGNYLVEGNIFVDSNIEFENIPLFRNNVFYGNGTYNNGKFGLASSYEVYSAVQDVRVVEIHYDDYNGKTYVIMDNYTGTGHQKVDAYKKLAEELGGELMSINSMEEYNFLKNNITNQYWDIITGIYYDEETGKLMNPDGTEVPSELKYQAGDYSEVGAVYFPDDVIDFTSTYATGMPVIEITKEILPKEIEFKEYVVYLDDEHTYQVHPTLIPDTAKMDTIFFESEDESIATVDENGVVTPVGNGTTNIRVYSKDKAVYNYVTVNVIMKVHLEEIKLEKQEISLNINETYNLTPILSPSNTTERNLEYAVEDGDIVTVDEFGNITAKALGNTKVTVKGEKGITAELVVVVEEPITGMEFKNELYITSLTKEDNQDFYPAFYPENATNQDLIWESSNPEICYVDENGKLVKLTEGQVTLKATTKNQKYSDTVKILIAEVDDVDVTKIQIVNNKFVFALTSSRDLYVWGGNIQTPQLILNGIDDFGIEEITNNYQSNSGTSQISKTYGKGAVLIDGFVYDISFSVYPTIDASYDMNNPLLLNVDQLESDGHSLYAISKDGAVWARGSNFVGQLGLGYESTYVEKFGQMNFDGKVTKIVMNITSFSYGNGTAILDDKGDVYFLGSNHIRQLTKVAENVMDIYRAKMGHISLDTGDSVYTIDESGEVLGPYLKINPEIKIGDNTIAYYIEDGYVKIKGNENSSGKYGLGHNTKEVKEFETMKNVCNVKELFYFTDNIYIQTSDGKFYSVGSGLNNFNATGKIENTNIPEQVVFGVELENEGLILENTSIIVDEDSLYYLLDDEISLDYNHALKTSSEYGYITLKDSNDMLYGLVKTIHMDKLSIKPLSDLKYGEIYTLSVPTGALNDDQANYNELYEVSFTYKNEKHKEVYDLIIGDTYNLETLEDASLEYAYATDNEAVATVSKDGLITAINPGTAKVTVTSNDGETLVKTVNVYESTYRIELNRNDLVLNRGMSGQLLAATYKKYGDYSYKVNTDVAGLRWHSNNPKIATVDENGLVTGVSNGETKIIAYTVDGVQEVCTVTVDHSVLLPTRISITPDYTVMVNPRMITPRVEVLAEEGMDASYTWFTDDSTNFYFHESENMVQANRTGTQKVYVTTVNGIVAETELTFIDIEVLPNTLKLHTNDTVNMYAVVAPYDFAYEKLTWSSNDTNVATVDENGVVTAVGEGTAYIKVALDNSSVLTSTGYTVKVDDSLTLPTTLEVPSELTLVVGKTEPVTPVVKDGVEVVEEIVDFMSLNKDVVTVNSSGITAVSVGETQVVYSTRTGLTGICNVKVVEEEIETRPITSIILRENEVSVEMGKAYQLFATINPEDTTDSKEITWTTSNNKVVFVNNNGKIVGVSKGTATVTATTSNGLTAECVVTVTGEVINETVVDEELMDDRYLKSDAVMTSWEDVVKKGYNTRFHSNVILNRLNNDDVDTWLQIATSTGGYSTIIGAGGNYWGTTNEELINKQILDYDDFTELCDILEGEYLTEAPSNTYPFVVDAYLEVEGEEVKEVGNQEITFVVKFNRAMDTTIPLRVRFGSSYPYAEYEIDGEYVSDTEWRGTTVLTTLIENGYQYWSVANGMTKPVEGEAQLKFFEDWGRFQFEINTSGAQALIMQAEPMATGIKLTWEQDDFDTLAGYNVYRSNKEDGLYEKINTHVIPADTKEFFDENVLPAELYYYNFTVVKTDLSESEPSGKVTARALDTMAPNIYHSVVHNAFSGNDLVISATVTDNLKLDEVTLYYRITGTEEWLSANMTNINDKYSAVIAGTYVTTAGLEYYIDAFDGVSHTYKGSAEEPFAIAVQVVASGSELGDVDMNGAINLKDAMMVSMSINDRINLTAERFARADIDGDGELTAAEALRIIQYINGKVPTIKF